MKLQGKTVIDLSAAQRDDLRRIARNGQTQISRRAAIVLARAAGAPLSEIARDIRMHRDSVRRWLVRFLEHGISGLRHGNAGKPKNVVFGPAVCAEIRRRALTSPMLLGEEFSIWSLSRLRNHLVREQVVVTISIERLRQLLGKDRGTLHHWGASRRSPAPVRGDVMPSTVRLISSFGPRQVPQTSEPDGSGWGQQQEAGAASAQGQDQYAALGGSFQRRTEDEP